MEYRERIRRLIERTDRDLIDLNAPRKRARRPTDVSSEFVTNKEQGDWAEALVLRAVNEHSRHYVAVKYGKSDDVMAGDAGFAEFYEAYQQELDTIGKRPDILLFRQEDYDPELGQDISGITHDRIDAYVSRAVAGIEIRSSSHLIDRYQQEKRREYEANAETVFACRQRLLTDYRGLMESDAKRRAYLRVVENIDDDNLDIVNLTLPPWGNTGPLVPVKNELRRLKEALKILQRQQNLSITPKVEDLKVVYRWIDTFNVPHFYFQVFFDKVFGISFEQILSIVADPANEGRLYEIGGDPKNQHKKTIKVYTSNATCIASRVTEPEHESVRREMARGRLLFHVRFHGGTALLDRDRLQELLNIDEL